METLTSICFSKDSSELVASAAGGFTASSGHHAAVQLLI
jgi:hypothetical protein